MAGFYTDIDKKSEGNNYYFKVIYTGPNSQLVVMALKPGEDIGMEVHQNSDQFIRVEEGHGSASLDNREFLLEPGSVLVVPAGSQHSIKNTSKTEPMKLYTVFSPPNYPDGVIYKTRSEAEAAEQDRK